MTTPQPPADDLLDVDVPLLGVPTTDTQQAAAPAGPAAVRIDSPADLQAVMKTPYAPSEQQWRAISAPLSPAVVIAGAGSGKTTLMAARVVYLVATGQVRPEEVLGLTFTTKAASELRQRIRAALRTAGVLEDPDVRPRPGEELEEVLEPTVLTYNAYAAQLLTEHGLRIGHEPDTRVITDAARYQLGARVVDRHTGSVTQLTDHPETAIQNLLALDGAMSEHLVGPDDVRRVDAEARRGFEAALAEERAGKDRTTYREPIEKAISAIDRRGELLGLVAGYRRLKRELGLMDFSDQIELGRAAGQRAARRRRPGAGEVQGRAPRRVPGHLGRPGHDVVAAVLGPERRHRARARGDRGRRPQPGDLRLARRLGLQHPQLRRHLPGGCRPGPDLPPHGEPPIRRADPRGRQPARRPAV